MRLWRLARAGRPHATLDDEAEGARRVGGRWNSKSVPVVYASAQIGTAALEVLVHMDWFVAPELVLLAIDVPDDASVQRLDAADLPPGWNAYPAPTALADLGNAWARSGASLLLDVPSAASPFEHNVLINPRHPDAARCTVNLAGPYAFDARLKA